MKLELWIKNKEEAIKRFFEELKKIDAESYLEIPLNVEEWKETKDPVVKMAVIVLLTAWINETLTDVWEGWFYKSGKFLVIIEPNEKNCTVAILNRLTGKVFVETYPIPQDLKPLFLIDLEGIFDES